MTDPLELLPDQRIAHIVAADAADAILVAPATARWLGGDGRRSGRRRHHRHLPGLEPRRSSSARRWTATCGATPRRVRNVETLRGFGYTIVEPEVGPLASGQCGVGRLAEPADDPGGASTRRSRPADPPA